MEKVFNYNGDPTKEDYSSEGKPSGIKRFDMIQAAQSCSYTAGE